MQKNCAVIVMFLLSAAMRGGVINRAEGETLTIKILSLAFPMVCLFLLTVWHPRRRENYTGNKKIVIPDTFRALPVSFNRITTITNGLHHQ